MAEVSGAKFHYDDHDTDLVDEDPPVQNTWYEVFHAEDVRLIWCTVWQNNTEAAAKTMEIRWTIDGNVYFNTWALASGTNNWIYRNEYPSTGGTEGLADIASARNAAHYVDKRGKDFKVEVRITEALGTAQRIVCRCVRETEDLT